MLPLSACGWPADPNNPCDLPLEDWHATASYGGDIPAPFQDSEPPFANPEYKSVTPLSSEDYDAPPIPLAELKPTPPPTVAAPKPLSTIPAEAKSAPPPPLSGEPKPPIPVSAEHVPPLAPAAAPPVVPKAPLPPSPTSAFAAHLGQLGKSIIDGQVATVLEDANKSNGAGPGPEKGAGPAPR